MTRRNRQTLAPTLFPFLAVLVCTLGTLILLLALVSQNAATAAEQEAHEELIGQQVVPLADPDQITAGQAAALIDEATVRIESLQAARDAQAADLESRRDQLTHLEEHIRRLSDELTRLAHEVKTATGSATLKQDNASRLVEIKREIAEYQQQIAELHHDHKLTAPRVVIVPHKGPNGTTRRPIYVECTTTGLTIWPEGVEISTEYLNERRSRGANPLDAALRVARLHIMQSYGDADPPYPLLVVRPHGTEAYFAATAAMDDWDDQYGYEMLDTDIELAVGTPDPNLRRRMKRAVAEAIERQGRRTASVAVPLSASQLARDGRNRGFGHRATHGYADHRESKGGKFGTNPHGGLAQQTSRLNNLYRQAADELRKRDSGSDGAHAGGPPSGEPGEPVPNAERQTVGRSEDHMPTPDGGSAGDPPSAQSQHGETVGTSRTNAQPAPHSDQAAPDIQVDATTNKLVERRGENWALPASVTARQGISIVRSIQVECHRDRLVILASRTEPAAVFPIRGDLNRAVLEFATEIRDRVERWGVALNDGRWQPQLSVKVIGDGRHRLRQLSELLEGSGIDLVERGTP